jgi:hypothetical protein
MSNEEKAVKKFDVKEVIAQTYDKALQSQHHLAIANVARLRRVHPEKSPAELVSFLNNWYVGSVTAIGAGAGAAAVLPNGVVQIPAAIADLGSFMTASAYYALSIAAIHEVDVEDFETRRLLVTAILLGNSANAVLEKAIPRLAKHWGKQIVAVIPRPAILAANKVLGPRFITITGTKVGVLVLGKQVPFLVGAGIGAVGNAVFAQTIVKSAKRVLGPAPTAWDAGQVEIPKQAKPKSPAKPKSSTSTRAVTKTARKNTNG